MTQDKDNSVQVLLERAGVRHDLVVPLAQELILLLQPNDHRDNSNQDICEAAIRFERERNWGG